MMNLLNRLEGRLYRELRTMSLQSSWYNEILFPDCNKFWKYGLFAPEATFDIKVVNLGSTSGLNAFNYSDIDIHAENWALRQNPLAADIAILQNYSSYLTSGATVIFSLCPFSTLSGSYDFQEDRYYTILNPRSIPGFSRKRLNRILSLRDNPLSAYPVVEAISAFKASLMRKLKIHRAKQSLSIDFAANAEQWMKNWLDEFGISNDVSNLSLINRDGIDDAVKYLNQGIAFCQEHGFRSVLVIPPMHRALAQLFTPELRALLIDSMIRRLPKDKFSFYNYMEAPEFCNLDGLFRDAFLLNDNGSKIFTRRFLCDIGIL